MDNQMIMTNSTDDEMKATIPNLSPLIHCCLLHSLATYNLRLEANVSFSKSSVLDITERVMSNIKASLLNVSLRDPFISELNLYDMSNGSILSLLSLVVEKGNKVVDSMHQLSSLYLPLLQRPVNNSFIRTSTSAGDGYGYGSGSGNGNGNGNDNKRRAAVLAVHSLGTNCKSKPKILSIRSDKACAMYLETNAIDYDERESQVIIVSFRGTKDIVDVITDLSILQEPFKPSNAYEASKSQRQSEGSIDEKLQSFEEGFMSVHYGFYSAFESLRPKLDKILKENNISENPRRKVLFTGHSMGGALGIAYTNHYIISEYRLINMCL
jgi:hypothetical protein